MKRLLFGLLVGIWLLSSLALAQKSEEALETQLPDLVDELRIQLVLELPDNWTLSALELRETARLDSAERPHFKSRFKATVTLEESGYALAHREDVREGITFVRRIAEAGEVRTLYGVVLATPNLTTQQVDDWELELTLAGLAGLSVGEPLGSFAGHVIVIGSEEKQRYLAELEAERVAAHQKALEVLEQEAAARERAQQEALAQLAQVVEATEARANPAPTTSDVVTSDPSTSQTTPTEAEPTQTPTDTVSAAEVTAVQPTPVTAPAESAPKDTATEEARVTPISDAQRQSEGASEVKQLAEVLRQREPNLLKTLEGHSLRVSFVDFSPDGQTLASTSEDATIRLWDVDSGTSRTLHGHQAWVNAVAFSPDGTRLASASDDSSVRVWDVASGKELFSLVGHEGRLGGV